MVQSSSWAGSRMLMAQVDQRTEDTDSVFGSAIYDTDNASLDHEDILLGSETFEERRPRESVVSVPEQQLGPGVDQQRERSVTLDASSRQTTLEPPQAMQAGPSVPLRSPYPSGTGTDVQAHKRLPSVLKDLPPLTLSSENGDEEDNSEEVHAPRAAIDDEDDFVNLSWPSGVHPHPEHYHECGDIVFQVQDQLFRLHSYILKRESTGSILQKSPSDEPVSLNVPAQDFERFVRVLYQPIYRPLYATAEDWISVLALATRWNFPILRQQAITQLSAIGINPVQRLMLAQAHGIQEWVIPSYVALCDREEPLTFAEGAEVGMKVVTLLAQARERVKLEKKSLFKKVEVAKIVTEVMEKIAKEDNQ